MLYAHTKRAKFKPVHLFCFNGILKTKCDENKNNRKGYVLMAIFSLYFCVWAGTYWQCDTFTTSSTAVQGS